MNKLFILVGYPASGKTTYAQTLHQKLKNSIILSRDEKGGNIHNMLPDVETNLINGKIVILDNTNLTKDVRKPFISLAHKLSVPVTCVYIKNTIEDSQIKVLHRMYEKYHQIFLQGKSKDIHDPGIFPPAALFAARKKFEEPSKTEGFDEIMIIDAPEPKWDGRRYRNKAVFFDIDGTLRKTDHLPLKYPTEPSQVVLIDDVEIMKKKLNKYIKDGYKLIGVSNQSGIAKKSVTEAQVAACMEETRRLLGFTEKEFPIMWCPHSPVPITCYCRKPQVGMIMQFVETLRLNPKKCIMVGDSKTDETLANRMKMTFIHADEFWH